MALAVQHLVLWLVVQSVVAVAHWLVLPSVVLVVWLLVPQRPTMMAAVTARMKTVTASVIARLAAVTNPSPSGKAEQAGKPACFCLRLPGRRG